MRHTDKRVSRIQIEVLILLANDEETMFYTKKLNQTTPASTCFFNHSPIYTTSSRIRSEHHLLTTLEGEIIFI